MISLLRIIRIRWAAQTCSTARDRKAMASRGPAMTSGQCPRSKDKAPALTDCSTPQRYERVPIEVDARNVLAFLRINFIRGQMTRRIGRTNIKGSNLRLIFSIYTKKFSALWETKRPTRDISVPLCTTSCSQLGARFQLEITRTRVRTNIPTWKRGPGSGWRCNDSFCTETKTIRRSSDCSWLVHTARSYAEMVQFFFFSAAADHWKIHEFQTIEITFFQPLEQIFPFRRFIRVKCSWRQPCALCRFFKRNWIFRVNT